MKKIVLALVASAVALPSISVAQTSDGVPGRFATERECEKAIRTARNDERRLDTEPGRERGALNKEDPDFRCQADPDGGFNVVPA